MRRNAVHRVDDLRAPRLKGLLMKLRRCFLGVGFILFGIASVAPADDWPQWLGPQRDSVWRETGIVEVFPENKLPVKWRVPISGGYAGPAVANGKVFVTD